MSDENERRGDEPEGYAAPEVEDLDSSEGASVTAAGSTVPIG